jgi:hypothetical protein
MTNAAFPSLQHNPRGEREEVRAPNLKFLSLYTILRNQGDFHKRIKSPLKKK